MVLALARLQAAGGDDMTDDRQRDVFASCDWCGKSIHFGNALVNLARHVEQVDLGPDDRDCVMTVVDAESLLTLCAACGNRLDGRALSDALRLGFGRRGSIGTDPLPLDDAASVPAHPFGGESVALIDALLALGREIEQTRGPEVAQSVYERILDWFAKDANVATRVRLARTEVNLAGVLAERGQTDAAVAVLEETLTETERLPDPAAAEVGAATLRNKAQIFVKLRRFDDAIATYDALVRRFADEPTARPHVAFALAEQGALLLSERGDSIRALEVLERVVDEFLDGDDPALATPAFRALVNAAVAFRELGHPETSIMLCDNAIGLAQRGAAAEPLLVARATVAKGRALMELDRHDEALGVFAALANTAPGDDAVQGEVCDALINCGVILGDRGRWRAASEVADRAAEIALGITAEEGGERAAHALLAKAYALWQCNDRDAALTVYDEVVQRFGADPALAPHVAEALYDRGCRLLECEAEDAALAAFEEVGRRFATATVPEVTTIVAGAMHSQGEILWRRGELARAREVAAALLSALGSVSLAGADEALAWARTVIGSGPS